MIHEANTDGEIREIAQMAEIIWHEAFKGIISKEQIDYMVDKFQSYHAIKDQTGNCGYRYFIISEDGKNAGYCGIQVTKENTMYLSKMYLLETAWGKGFFTEMKECLVGICKKEGISSIWLTVNKNNSRAIAAYEKNGFRNIRSQVADIGNGFVMDDYVFELTV